MNRTDPTTPAASPAATSAGVPGAGAPGSGATAGDVGSIAALEVARAALAAHAGGSAVAVVTVVPWSPAGEANTAGAVDTRAGSPPRLLVFENGDVRGSLGDSQLDQRAAELAHETLAGGLPAMRTVEHAGRRWMLYAEAHHGPPELLVVGAGHIAVPLAELGVMMGYRVTVLDDREDFATPERFPDQARVLRMDFSDPFRDVAIGARSHILLVTRAHKYDFDCLQRLVQDDVSPAYIGMIGSRRRVRAAFHALLEAGIPRARLAAVRAPVGLDISAETPEEIAVSIAAELILLRRTGKIVSAAPLSDQERVLDRLLPG
jgi:xanthine dehydrogenase accessory factor